MLFPTTYIIRLQKADLWFNWLNQSQDKCSSSKFRTEDWKARKNLNGLGFSCKSPESRKGPKRIPEFFLDKAKLTHNSCWWDFSSFHQEPDSVSSTFDELNGFSMGHIFRVDTIDFNNLIT